MANEDKKPDDHFFATASDCSAKAEELALQLHTDAQHLAKKYPSEPISDLAERIAAQLASEQADDQNFVNVRAFNESPVVSLSFPSPTLHIVESENDTRDDPAGQVAWWKIAAAALLLVSATTVVMWRQIHKNISASPSVAVVIDRLPNKKPSVAIIAGSNESATGIVSESESDSIVPNIFKSLSGPQQEALLDLLDENGHPRVSLSI